MEKITKEELMEELKLHNLSDEDIEKVAGGSSLDECMEVCKAIKDPKEAHWCRKNCSIFGSQKEQIL